MKQNVEFKNFNYKIVKNPTSFLKSYCNNRLYFTLTMCLFVFLCNKKVL